MASCRRSWTEPRRASEGREYPADGVSGEAPTERRALDLFFNVCDAGGASRRKGNEPMTAKGSLAGRTDDELSREVFGQLFVRFEAARKRDRSIHVIDMWSVGFKLSRHGSLLVVNQGQEGRLLEITLLGTHKPEGRTPWRAAIWRSLDRTRLALVPGPEGTVDDIVEEVVRTVLGKTGPQT